MAAMNGRRVRLSPRPPRDPGAEVWVRGGDGEAATPNKAERYTARLTIDVTPALRSHIKIIAFRQGLTVAEMLRGLLEREYGDDDSGAADGAES